MALGVASVRNGSTIFASTSAPQQLLSLTSGNFIAGHQYLVLAFSSVRAKNITSTNELRFNGVTDPKFTTVYYAPGVSSGMPIFMMGLWTAVSGHDIQWWSVPSLPATPDYRYVDTTLMAIDLDSVERLSDRYVNEDNSVIGLDLVYANSVGASITFTPDGTSSYMIIGGGTFVPTNAGDVDDFAKMELFDSVSGQLNEQELGNPNSDAGWGHNALSILNAPAAVPRTVSLRFANELLGNWSHNHSCLFIFRLEASVSSVFGENTKNLSYTGGGIQNIMQNPTFVASSGNALAFGRVCWSSRSINYQATVNIFHNTFGYVATGEGQGLTMVGTTAIRSMGSFVGAKLTGIGTGNKFFALRYAPSQTQPTQIVFETAYVALDLDLVPVPPIIGSLTPCSIIAGALALGQPVPPQADVSGYPIALGDSVGPSEQVNLALISDGASTHRLAVVSPTVLGKNGTWGPAYDFNGPAGSANLGLRPGDKVSLLNIVAVNHGRVFAIKSVTATQLELTDLLTPGDELLEFDFELIRRRG